MDIKALMDLTSCTIQHRLHKGIKYADFLVNKGADQDEYLIWLNELPEDLKALVYANSIKVTHCRH